VSDDVELLDRATNRAVVHVPGRKFPGVVLQGDTLSTLTYGLRDLRATLTDEDQLSDLDLVLDTLEGALENYEAVLSARGMALPYVRR